MQSRHLVQIATEISMKKKEGMFTNKLIRDKDHMKSRKKQKLKEKASTYSNSLSLHGVERIRKGKPIEKIIYSLALFTGFMFICASIQALFIKYQSYAVYIQVTTKQTAQNKFPSMSICINHGGHITSYCGRNMNKKLPAGLKFCNWDKKIPITKSTFWYLEVKELSYWRNDDFTVSTEDFHMRGKFLWDYWKATNHSRVQCITFNEMGTFYNYQGKIKFTIELTPKHHSPQKTPNIDLIIHQPGENPFVKDTGIFRLTTAFNYKVSIGKTELIRLPSPYPSRCTTNNKNNIFTQNYSVLACQETVRCKNALSTCGDTFDFCKDFLSPKLLARYKQNNPYRTTQTCLIDRMESFIATGKECPLPCIEMKYKASTTAFAKRNKERYAFDLILEHEDKYSYTSVEEKEMHSWYQFLGEVGGFACFMMGISLVTVIEIFTYLTLSVIAKCCYKKRECSPTCDFIF